MTTVTLSVYDWVNSTCESAYDTPEGVALITSPGQLHHGTVIQGELCLDADQIVCIQKAKQDGISLALTVVSIDSDTELICLQAEVTELKRMIADLPESSVIDRHMLEARLAEVRAKIRAMADAGIDALTSESDRLAAMGKGWNAPANTTEASDRAQASRCCRVIRDMLARNADQSDTSYGVIPAAEALDLLCLVEIVEDLL